MAIQALSHDEIAQVSGGLLGLNLTTLATGVPVVSCAVNFVKEFLALAAPIVGGLPVVGGLLGLLQGLF